MSTSSFRVWLVSHEFQEHSKPLCACTTRELAEGQKRKHLKDEETGCVDYVKTEIKMIDLLVHDGAHALTRRMYTRP